MHIDILWISGLGLVMGKFGQFLTEFQGNNLSKSQWIFTNFGMCIDILSSIGCPILLSCVSGLGLLIGKFRQFLTELSAHDMTMARHYRFTFLFFSSEYHCGHHH